MRFFHSYWNKPALARRWNIDRQTRANLWLFALSVAYLKENNREVILHTDVDGERLLSCLPYDNIYRTLDALADVNPDFWCAGKLTAYAAEPLGSIHLDGDVLLKSGKTFESLDISNTDCLVQSEEFVGDFYRGGYDLICHIYAKQGLQPPFEPWITAYNMGVVGFNNETLKRNYLNGCWSIYNTMMRDLDYRARNRNDDSLLTLNVEQRFFHWLADVEHARVKVLLDKECIYKDAVSADYCHVIGRQKYDSNILIEVKNCLNLLSPGVYAKVAAREKDLGL
jgi:hypothetical protein